MIVRNTPLKIGLAVIAASLLGAAWFIVRELLHQNVPLLWSVGIGLLFLVYVFKMFGGQIESKLSWGSGDDDVSNVQDK